jgi:hypothetical protein
VRCVRIRSGSRAAVAGRLGRRTLDARSSGLGRLERTGLVRPQLPQGARTATPGHSVVPGPRGLRIVVRCAGRLHTTNTTRWDMDRHRPEPLDRGLMFGAAFFVGRDNGNGVGWMQPSGPHIPRTLPAMRSERAERVREGIPWSLAGPKPTKPGKLRCWTRRDGDRLRRMEGLGLAQNGSRPLHLIGREQVRQRA